MRSCGLVRKRGRAPGRARIDSRPNRALPDVRLTKLGPHGPLGMPRPVKADHADQANRVAPAKWAIASGSRTNTTSNRPNLGPKKARELCPGALEKHEKGRNHKADASPAGVVDRFRMYHQLGGAPHLSQRPFIAS